MALDLVGAAGLDAARQVAEGARDLGPYYVAGLAWIVVGILFGWIMRINALRLSDRDRMGDKVEALAEKLAAHVDAAKEVSLHVLHELQELRAARRRKGGGTDPALRLPPSGDK